MNELDLINWILNTFGREAVYDLTYEPLSLYDCYTEPLFFQDWGVWN